MDRERNLCLELWTDYTFVSENYSTNSTLNVLIYLDNWKFKLRVYHTRQLTIVIILQQLSFSFIAQAKRVKWKQMRIFNFSILAILHTFFYTTTFVQFNYTWTQRVCSIRAEQQASWKKKSSVEAKLWYRCETRGNSHIHAL